MMTNKKINERLAEALVLRNMSGPDLARKTGINKGTIWRYINGDIIPKQNAISKMAQALGVSPAWLLGYDLTPEGDPIVTLDLEKLTDKNRELLLAYYSALVDSQEAQNGKP